MKIFYMSNTFLLAKKIPFMLVFYPVTTVRKAFYTGEKHTPSTFRYVVPKGCRGKGGGKTKRRNKNGSNNERIA